MIVFVVFNTLGSQIWYNRALRPHEGPLVLGKTFSELYDAKTHQNSSEQWLGMGTPKKESH